MVGAAFNLLLRMAWPLRFLTLAALYTAIVTCLYFTRPAAAYIFVLIAVLSVILKMIRAEVGLFAGIKVRHSSASPERLQARSDNNDANAAKSSERPLSIWSTLFSSLITALFIGLIALLPIGWVWISILGVVGWILTGGQRKKLAAIELKDAQSKRDQFAALVLEKLDNGSPVEDYCLYLRPFNITGIVRAFEKGHLEKSQLGMHPTDVQSEDLEEFVAERPVAMRKLNVVGDEGLPDEINSDFEAVLERGLRRKGRLVGLGVPGEAVGAGRILTSEQTWRDRVIKLGGNARCFVVLPAPNPGTEWEIKWLKETRLFSGCLFVMPGAQPGFDGAAYWASTRQALRNTVKLPRFFGLPAIFCFDSNGVAYGVALAARGLARDKAPVSFVTARLVRKAANILLPISVGHHVLPTLLSKIVSGAFTSTQEVWNKHEVWRQIDAHPARKNATRVGHSQPNLKEKPLSIWLLGRTYLIEFGVEAPIEDVSVIAIVKFKFLALQFVGFNVLASDDFALVDMEFMNKLARDSGGQ